MAPDTFFLLSGAFALTTLSTAAIAARSPSRWRFVTPLTVALSLMVAYVGLDAVTGSAKPVGIIPGWSRPDLKGDGAVVLSATPFGDGRVVLTLQEGKGAEPRLYSFPASQDLMDALKRAQEQHAKTHGGEKFGFSMKEGGQDGQGAGKGTGHPGTAGDGRPTQPTPYHFAEPAQAALPPKDG
jgi:hypothetical protein